MWDLVHRLSCVQSLATANLTTSSVVQTGAAVAVTGYESISALLHVSTISAGTVQPSLQFSNASGGTYYALDASSYIGGAAPGTVSAVGDTLIGVMILTSATAVAAGVANTGLTFGEIVVTPAGATVLMNADFILGHPRHSGVGV